MRMIYLIHIVGGALSLGAGYLALYTTKGAPLHRRSGMVFVYAMLTMCAFGTILAIAHGEWAEVNVPAGVLTAYLVITSLTTVRRPARRVSRWLDPLLMVVAMTVGLTCLTFGIEAVVAGGTRNGVPAFPFFMFGVVGTIAGFSDLRMLRNGALQGSRRLARHLWRMSFSLFIAAMSFFIGQAKVIPEPIRIMPLLAMPVLAVLVTMVYWLWRVRFRKEVNAREVVERISLASQ